MSFSGKYLDWNKNRIKAIVDFYGSKFFYYKKVLELGAGYGDIGAVFNRLGSEVTAVDARDEHLKIISKKFPGIKTVKSDFDRGWDFKGKKYDVVLHLGVLCHLNNFEAHLKSVCQSANHLVLETAVFDSPEDTFVNVQENKSTFDSSYNGNGCRPTSTAIEKILMECGFTFKRHDSNKLNSGEYEYDWVDGNSKSISLNKRRMWFCVSKDSAFQIKQEFKAPIVHVNNSEVLSVSFTPEIQKIPDIKNLSIQESNQLFALSKKQPNVSNFIINKSFNFTDLSQKKYFDKLKYIYPDLKISDSPNILFCDNTIKKCNSVFIESSEYINIDDLRYIDNIYTNSLKTCLYLSDKLNKEVKFFPKLWATTIPTKVDINQEYILYFNKNNEFTEKLISLWDRKEKLIIVNYKGLIPNHIICLNEYYDYSKILYLMQNCKCVIDFNINKDYHSAIIDLCNHLNTPVITNNYFGIDKNNCLFVLNNNYLNLIDNIKSTSRNDMLSYNHKVVQNMKNLV